MKKRAEIAIVNTSAEPGNRTHVDRRILPKNDEISQLAFRLFEARGRQDGFDIEDWLRAEQELLQHYTQRRRIHNPTRRTEMVLAKRKAIL